MFNPVKGIHDHFFSHSKTHYVNPCLFFLLGLFLECIYRTHDGMIDLDRNNVGPQSDYLQQFKYFSFLHKMTLRDELQTIPYKWEQQSYKKLEQENNLKILVEAPCSLHKYKNREERTQPGKTILF